MSTGTDVASEVRTQLNDGDASNRRWADAEILAYTNAGQRQIVMLVPEANVVEELVEITSRDVRRTLPAGGVKFFGVRNYDQIQETPGPVPTVVELDAMDSTFPEWMYPEHQTGYLNHPTFELKHGQFLFEHFAHDPRDPKTYYLFPPPPTDVLEAELLERSGMTDTSISQANLTRSTTYVLPDGTDNRMIVIAGHIREPSGLTIDPDDLVFTYGGVAMNAQILQWVEDSGGTGIDGLLGHTFLLLLSVDGETFSDDEFVIDGSAWTGLLGGNVVAVDFEIYVFENINPAAEDFSGGYEESADISATITLPVFSAVLDGQLVFSVASSANSATEYQTDGPLVESGMSNVTYGDGDSWNTTDFIESTIISRTAWSVATAGDISVTWDHPGNETYYAPESGWGAVAVLLVSLGGDGPMVLLRYSKLTTALAALSDDLELGDEYFNALVEYVTFRCLMKDGRHTMSVERRAELWNNFLRALGLKVEADDRVDIASKRPPDDDHG